jgi:hypothetical protein
LLENLIPPDHVHAGWRSGFSSIDEYRKFEDIRKKIGFLRAIRDDFSRGLLDRLDRRIEGIIAADYMGQAEGLLSESATGKYDHVPAAVLAGAVLEKFLRSLCTSQSPQVPVTDRKGSPLSLNALIDGLKQVGAIEELTAKHLRAYAGTRNKAAHGEFDGFKRTDVELMLKGINDFLAEHAGE